jgi:hypothetical protein
MRREARRQLRRAGGGPHTGAALASAPQSEGKRDPTAEVGQLEAELRLARSDLSATKDVLAHERDEM